MNIFQKMKKYNFSNIQKSVKNSIFFIQKNEISSKCIHFFEFLGSPAYDQIFTNTHLFV